MNLYFFPFVKEQPIPSAQGRSQDTTGAFASDFAWNVVEVNGIEPMTPCLQSRCSPS